jgi:hydroxymethylpyrimidine/phosphomethylpyrimidine kinase
VVTGAYMRDTAEIFDHIAFEDDAVAEQARSVLEDAFGTGNFSSAKD